MKKFIAMLLALVMVFALAACGGNNTTTGTTSGTTNGTTSSTTESTGTQFDPSAKDEGTMTYEEFMAAEMDSTVVVECFVQAHQAWWFDSDAGYGKITVYAQDPAGAYFLYEMQCAEEDAARLVPGTKIKVTGVKGEWAGEIEIMEATFEIMEGTWVAEAADMTALLGTEDMEAKMNQLGAFKGLTVVSWEYQNETVGKDIYLTVSYNGAEYEFCVESYLTADGTEVYEAVEALNAGDIINVEAFVYWYEGPNPHITAVEVVG